MVQNCNQNTGHSPIYIYCCYLADRININDLWKSFQIEEFKLVKVIKLLIFGDYYYLFFIIYSHNLCWLGLCGQSKII